MDEGSVRLTHMRQAGTWDEKRFGFQFVQRRSQL
jgi:hypothetical protein